MNGIDAFGGLGEGVRQVWEVSGEDGCGVEVGCKESGISSIEPGFDAESTKLCRKLGDGDGTLG